MKKILIALAFLLPSLFFLALAVKGDTGTPLAFQYEKNTSVGGPFEASNNTSRYALVEAIVEQGRFSFTEEQASFSTPDLVKYKDTYFSIFTPGVSFVAVPFYILGKQFYAPQIFAYFSTLIFALLNMVMIRTLAKKFGANEVVAWFSAGLFLFGTNAFVYALTLTQHHFSTFLILLSLLIASQKPSFLRNLSIGMVYAGGILVDIPNAFMMFPVLLYIAAQHIQVKDQGKKSVLSINFSGTAILLGMIPFLVVFFLYNYSLTGSYTKIGQFIGQYNYPTKDSQIAQQKIPDLVNKDQSTQPGDGVSVPFKTRLQLQDFYILFLSQERAWWYYSPVILIGIFGLLYVCIAKIERTLAILAMSVALVDVTIYTMFGDPWGGWAFGPRYLIPAAGILAIFIAPILMKVGKNIVFAIPFSLLAIYSIVICTFGALTTAAIPPYGEAQHQNFIIPYTWEYNLEILQERNTTSSLLFNMFWRNNMSAFDYAVTIATLLSAVYLLIYLFGILELHKHVSTLRGRFLKAKK